MATEPPEPSVPPEQPPQPAQPAQPIRTPPEILPPSPNFDVPNPAPDGQPNVQPGAPTA
jgi:hypothetical protein